PKKTDDLIDKTQLEKDVTDGQAANATDAQKKAAKEAKGKLAALAKDFKPTDEFRYTRVLVAGVGSDGGTLDQNDFTAGAGLQDNKRGLYALDKADLFNLLCIPPEQRGESTNSAVYSDALSYCQAHRAVLIVDSPAEWSA